MQKTRFCIEIKKLLTVVPLQSDSLLSTIKWPGVPGTNLKDLGMVKG